MTRAAPRGRPRDWDAEVYDRVSQPQLDWGHEVVARLELEGRETVLDAGCGSGRVTELLLARLPRGKVIAVDASPSMVEKAREKLGDRAQVMQADLVALTLPEPVNVVFSSAVFHWIPDHDRLFRTLHALLRPGGRLVAQCGGEGNIRALTAALGTVLAEEPFAASFAGWSGPWNFAGPEETRSRLQSAGFEEPRCWLEDRPVTPDDPRHYLEVVTLGPHLDRLPNEQRAAFVERVLELLPAPLSLDYVRLNIDARRPG